MLSIGSGLQRKNKIALSCYHTLIHKARFGIVNRVSGPNSEMGGFLESIRPSFAIEVNNNVNIFIVC